MKKLLRGAILTLAASVFFTCSVWAGNTKVVVPKTELIRIPITEKGKIIEPQELVQIAQKNSNDAGDYKTDTLYEFGMQMLDEEDFSFYVNVESETSSLVKSPDEEYTINYTTVETPFFPPSEELSYQYRKGTVLYSKNLDTGEWEYKENITDKIRLEDMGLLIPSQFFTYNSYDILNMENYKYGKNVESDGQIYYTVEYEIDPVFFKQSLIQFYEQTKADTEMMKDTLEMAHDLLNQADFNIQGVFYINNSKKTLDYSGLFLFGKIPPNEVNDFMDIEIYLNSYVSNYDIGEPVEFPETIFISKSR